MTNSDQSGQINVKCRKCGSIATASVLGPYAGPDGDGTHDWTSGGESVDIAADGTVTLAFPTEGWAEGWNS